VSTGVAVALPRLVDVLALAGALGAADAPGRSAWRVHHWSLSLAWDAGVCGSSRVRTAARSAPGGV